MCSRRGTWLSFMCRKMEYWSNGVADFAGAVSGYEGAVGVSSFAKASAFVNQLLWRDESEDKME